MSPRPPSTDPVFIVGLYKNGTSWLLSALAAHPEFAALRELDVLRSVAGRDGRRLLPPRERLANVFGRSAFCALRAEQLQHARPLYDLPPEQAVAGLARLVAVEGGKGGPWVSQGRPLGFLNFTPELLAGAFAALRDAATPAAAMDGFLAALAPGLPPGRRLVLKGADQILSLDALKDWRPAAPRIAIVRDGRDAAVSAYHYRELMRTLRMAWHHSHLSFVKPLALARDAGIRSFTALRRFTGHGPDWRLGRSMSVWADRVRRVLAAAERGELYVMRYEDLLTDFDLHFTHLLRWLDAEASPGTVAAVAQASSFEAVSGRPPGVAGQDVIRKGISGEWRESLTVRDRAAAWRIAGAELAAMGYGRDGVLETFEPPTRH